MGTFERAGFKRKPLGLEKTQLPVEVLRFQDKKNKKKKDLAWTMVLVRATTGQQIVTFEKRFLKTCQVPVSQVPVNRRWLICRY